MNSRLAWQIAGLLAWGVRKLRPHPVEPPPRPQPLRDTARIMTPVGASTYEGGTPLFDVISKDELELIELAAFQEHRGESALAELNRVRAGYGGLRSRP